MTVLIADDEDLARYTVRTLLSRHHPELSVVAEASDGDEAVALAAEWHPDLAILDIRMPGLDGLEAARRIRERHPEIAVIILTAYEDFSLAQQAVNAGIDGYLLKPVGPEALAERLEAVNGKRRRRFPQEELSGREATTDQEDRSGLSWRLARALEFMDAHLGSDMSMDQVSGHVGISPQHLSRLFREEMETSFTKYLTEHRIERACRLLDDTPLGIAEVADRCGYTDANYFAKVFRKYRGVSPGDYRRRNESTD